MVIDVDRYDIFKNYSIERVSDDIINGFLCACCTEGISKKLNLIMVFRSISKGVDYKIDFNNDVSEEHQDIVCKEVIEPVLGFDVVPVVDHGEDVVVEFRTGQTLPLILSYEAEEPGST